MYYYKKFTIKNYKGINEIIVNLPKNGVVTLVGLNESGKTTILEAINTFYNLLTKQRKFDESEFESIIPRSDIASFTGDIEVIVDIGKDDDDDDDEEEEEDIQLKLLIKFKRGKYVDIDIQFLNIDGSELSENDEDIEKKIEKMPAIYFYDDFLETIPDSITYYLISIDNQKYLYPSDSKWGVILDEVFSNANKNESFYSTLKDFDFVRNERAIDGKIRNMGQHITNEISNLWKELTGKNYQFKEIFIQNEQNEANSYGQCPENTKRFISEKIAQRQGEGYSGRFEFLKTIKISMKVKNRDNSEFDIEERSKGCRWFFSFLLFTYFRKENRCLFLLDEPGSNLHGSIQESICNKAFNKLSQNCCVIYSTHSPYLINMKYKEYIYIISNLNENENDNISKIIIKKVDCEIAERGFTENSHIKILMDHIAFKLPNILNDDKILDDFEVLASKQRKLKPMISKIKPVILEIKKNPTKWIELLIKSLYAALK